MAEVQEIIVKYIGEVDDLKKSLKELKKENKELKKAVEDVGESVKGQAKKTETEYKNIGSQTRGLTTKFKGLGGAVAGAFAAKALVEFGKALVKVSLETDQLAPKVERLKKNWRGFLEILAKQGGVTDGLAVATDAANDLLEVSNKMLSTEKIALWKRVGMVVMELARSLQTGGLSAQMMAEAFRTMEKTAKDTLLSFGRETKKLSAARKKALEELVKNGKIEKDTYIQLRNSLLIVTDAQKTLDKVINDIIGTKEEDKKATVQNREALQAFADLSPVAQEEIESVAMAYDLLGKEVAESGESFFDLGESLATVLPDQIIRLNEARAAMEAFAESARLVESIVSDSLQLAGGEMEHFAVFQKSIALFETTANQAIAISAAIASASKSSNPIQLALQIAAAVATVLTAFQQVTQAINKAGEPPTYGEGGWIGGRLHSQGGTTITAELDEFVVRRSEAKKYPDLLEAVNAGKFEKYIIDTYMPSFQKYQEQKDRSFAENLAYLAPLNGYNDRKLRNAIIDGYSRGDRNTSRIVNAIVNTKQSNRRGF